MGTEHILLALVREGEGGAAEVLRTAGVTHDRVRAAVLGMIGPGAEPAGGELSFTGPAQDAIDRARREAAIRDRPKAGTEHLLLALLRKQDGAAVRILLQLDADPGEIRDALAVS